jgi:putative glutamine amidotransferase
MPRRPIIGVTVDHNTVERSAHGAEHTQYLLPFQYTIAVEKAGGIPLMIPYRNDPSCIPELLKLFDGFVFSGGNDYNPAAWGEPRHPKAVPTDPDRESFERALLKAIEDTRKPILGICGGYQLMNITRGGSLHQFIPDQTTDIEHRRASVEEWSRRHPVRLEPGSKIASIVGTTDLPSNTSHKQAIHQLGRDLVVTGRAPDGVIEAIEDPTRPFYVGVQWHPERQHDEPAQLKLFQALIQQSLKDLA